MSNAYLRSLAALFIMAVTASCASATGAEWTFAPPSASPAAQSMAPGSASPDATPDVDGDVRVIELEATGALQFAQEGIQVRDIPVTPGETVLFRVDNTAGFDHNLYIGTDAELSAPNATTDVGIPTWESGVQELEWSVPEDISGLKFGCTVPGHYTTMQGTFSPQA
ncbi:hypothetical protein BH23CHL8_BH23CHL8_01320 [soil metagenome]